MNPVIFVLVGQIASGKGTVTQYLEETHGASTYRFSTILRDMLDRIHQEHSRKHITQMSEAVRTYFGEDILAYTIAEDTKKDQSPLIVIDGARRPEDLTYLQTLPGYVLVSVEASMQTRYTRLIERTENSDDQTKTFDQFVADHDLPTERTIASVMETAHEILLNEEDQASLFAQVDQLIETYHS